MPETIHAVFLDDRRMKKKESANITGQLILFNDDGQILSPFNDGQCVIKEFKDINGDGIVEQVGAYATVSFFMNLLKMSDGSPPLKVMYVLPIRLPLKPILKVAYDIRWTDADWSWRLVDTDGDGVCDVEMGPIINDGANLFPSRDDIPQSIKPTIRYRWSRKQYRYTGPAGDATTRFRRLNDANQSNLDDVYQEMRNVIEKQEEDTETGISP